MTTGVVTRENPMGTEIMRIDARELRFYAIAKTLRLIGMGWFRFVRGFFYKGLNVFSGGIIGFRHTETSAFRISNSLFAS